MEKSCFQKNNFEIEKKVRNIFNKSFSKKVFSVNNDLGNMKREKKWFPENFEILGNLILDTYL